MCSCIRIGLVADHPLFREGLAEALGASANLTIVAQGRTADDALRMATDATLDILLLEIEIPGNGIDAVRAIRGAKCKVSVVIVTALDNEELVIEALRAGAQGYILKNVTGADLICAIEFIHRGEPHVTPALASRLLSRLVTRRDTLFRDLIGLTSRERQVLSHVSRGLTNREIALQLGISIKTVKQHTMVLFSKMGVRNRVEATVMLRNTNP